VGSFLILLLLRASAAGALAGVPFTAGLSAVALVVPVCMWIVRWWITRTTVYELTTQRLKITRGILNRRLDEVELFRVKDYVMDQPLFLRLVGLGNLTLVSSDASTPRIALRAIAGVLAVRENSAQPCSQNAIASACVNSTWTEITTPH
jgi:uncharacterized membrane protein YdbT with pleckstrin-like domain